MIREDGYGRFRTTRISADSPVESIDSPVSINRTHISWTSGVFGKSLRIETLPYSMQEKTFFQADGYRFEKFDCSRFPKWALNRRPIPFL